jgi:molybdopterin-guanine dinucleotide biosynthesis protein
VNAKLGVFAERLVELGEVVFVLSNLADKIHRLLHKVLANHLEDFVLLEGFTGDVEGKIFRVDDTLDEVEVLGNEVLTVIHDEYTADVEFDVIVLLLGLEGAL